LFDNQTASNQKGPDMARTPVPAAHLRLQHLHLAEILDGSGTVRAAAAQLGRTQPALTKMLQEMEAAVQARLFDRGRLGARPTPSGRAFIERARVILNEWAVLQDELAAIAQGAAEILRIGATPLTTIGLLPQAMRRFRESRPGVRMRIREASIHDLILALIGGEIDCAIGRFSGELHDVEGFRSLRHEPLYDETLAVVAAPGHPLARRRRASWAALAAADWALPPVELATRQMLNAAFVRAGQIPPHPLYESASFVSNIAFANQLGVLSVAPEDAVRMAVGYGLVAVVRTELGAFSAPISIVRRRQAVDGTALGDFMEALRSVTRARR